MSSRFTDSATLAALPVASAADTRRNALADEVVDLFDQFRGPLLRYLSTLGLPLPDGEEVIQEVFLALFQHLDRGKSRENLRGWLFRVAHNLALKRRSRTLRNAEAPAETIDPSPNPEDQLLNHQDQQRMLAVVHALPGQDRKCLFLRAEGLRYRDIAGILDMSLGAVSLSLSRSLARIARSAER